MKKRIVGLLLALSMLLPVIAAAEDEYYGDSYGDDLFYQNYVTGLAISDCRETATDVVIPDTINNRPVREIGWLSFNDLPELTSITLPSTLIKIRDSAFARCPKLTNVYISDLASYLNIEFENYVSNPMYYADKLYLNNEPITDPVVPDSVTEIPCYAFQGCGSLKSITIPKSVTEIGAFAFDECEGLESVIYEGTKEEWNAIKINMHNDALKNANISYTGFSWTYSLPDGASQKKEIIVSADGIDAACTLILAAYKGGEFVGLSVKECTAAEKSVAFALPQDFSEEDDWSFDAFAWDGLSTMTPLASRLLVQTEEERDITDKFTDAAFLQEIRTIIGKTNGEPIYKADVCNITELNLERKDIYSLAGIEYLTGLQTLNCTHNHLSSLDLSANTELTQIICPENDLHTLNISNNKKLTHLNCEDNVLNWIDFSNNTELTYLKCANNELMTLDVSKNTKLTNLQCWFNDFETLDVSHNTALEKLDCSYNVELLSIDLSHNTALKRFDCNYTTLTALDASNNPELVTLVCFGTDIEQLDVSGCLKLQELDCYQMKLTELDISENPELTYLDCGYNELNTLDVSKNSKLLRLGCTKNALASLDVSANTELTELYCRENLLTALDVSANTKLTKLDCRNNQMTAAADVIGWQNIGLTLGDTFLFEPQGTAENTD